MTRVHVLPAAGHDVDRAAEHSVGEASVDLAVRFLLAVENANQRLVEPLRVNTASAPGLCNRQDGTRREEPASIRSSARFGTTTGRSARSSGAAHRGQVPPDLGSAGVGLGAAEGT